MVTTAQERASERRKCVASGSSRPDCTWQDRHQTLVRPFYKTRHLSPSHMMPSAVRAYPTGRTKGSVIASFSVDKESLCIEFSSIVAENDEMEMQLALGDWCFGTRTQCEGTQPGGFRD